MKPDLIGVILILCALMLTLITLVVVYRLPFGD
jgi:hypothetical protein